MGKLVKKIAIGGAIIGIGIATGGIGLAPALSSAGVAGVGAFTAGTALATTALGSTLLLTGGGMILTGLTGALAKKPSVSGGTTDRLTANLVLDAPRKIVFGRTALATDIRYQEWSGKDQDYLDQVLVVASHRVTSIEEVWFEDKLAWTVNGGAQGQYRGYFWCDGIFEGQPGAGFPIEQGRWNATTGAMAGCAQVHFRFKLSGNSKKAESPFSSSVPTRVTIRGRAAPVYDPRQDSSVGGSGPMRATDQATWAWSSGGQDIGRNLPLQLLFYLLGWRINGKLAVGCGLPADRIDLDSFMTAANMAWEPILRTDGSTEPRYAGDGTFTEGDDPKQVIATFEASMNGKLRDRNGKLALQLFHNDLATPVIELTEHDVLADFTWSPGESLEAKQNVVRGRYTDASDSSLYQMVDYPAVRLPSLDGIDRFDPVDYALVQSASQAQRLAKQRLQRAQYPGTFTATFNAKGWAAQDGDVVALRFPALGFARKIFRVEASVVDPTGAVPMTLIEEHASIYAWDRDERAEVQGAGPGTYNPILVPIVQAIDVAGQTAIWNAITGDNKPDDNATNSADPDSAFGPDGKTVRQIISDIAAALAGSGADTAEIAATLARIEAAARQGSPNLMIGGGFANGLEGWSLSAPGAFSPAFYPGNVGTYITSNNGVPGPKFMFKDVPAVAGVALSMSVEGARYAGIEARTYAKWVDGQGNDLSPPVMQIVPAGWGVRYQDGPIAPPQGAAALRFVLEINDAQTQCDIARVMVQQGPATDWRDDASVSAVTRSVTQLAGDQAAYAAAVETLRAQLQLPAGGGLADVLAEINRKGQVGVDAGAAVGQLSQAVAVRFGGVDQAIGTKADAAQTIEALANQDQSIAKVRTDLVADYDGKLAVKASNSQVTEAVASEAQARTAAIAEQRVTFNGKTISLQQMAALLATPDGKFQGLWSVGFNDGVPVLSVYYRDDNGNVIEGAYIRGNLLVDGTITARKFLTDQGVDLAAIVPGSLNWRLSSGSAAYVSGESFDTGIISSTGLATLNPAHRIKFKFQATFSSNTVPGNGGNATVRIYYALNGSGWIYTGQSRTIVVNSPAVVSWETDWPQAGSGEVKFAYQIQGGAPPGYYVAVSDHSLQVEAVFWK